MSAIFNPFPMMIIILVKVILIVIMMIARINIYIYYTAHLHRPSLTSGGELFLDNDCC